MMVGTEFINELYCIVAKLIPMKLLLPLLLLSVSINAQQLTGYPDPKLPKRIWVISSFGIKPEKEPVGKAVQRVFDSAVSGDSVTIIRFDIPGNYCFGDLPVNKFGCADIRLDVNTFIAMGDQESPAYYPFKYKDECQWSFGRRNETGSVCLSCCITPKKPF
jgi:hypothetical protein